MPTPLPSPDTINTARAYVVDGVSYKGLLETARSVRAMTGAQGIEVMHSEDRITIGLAGKQDPNTTNGASLTWSVQPLQVCNGNTVSTIYVLAGVALA
jgi:hypothetical protein